MKIFVIVVVFIAIVALGFYAMGKIDIFRREQSRKKGIPMDEED